MYRVGDDCARYELIRAAEAGKRVACAIGLKSALRQGPQPAVGSRELQRARRARHLWVMGLKTHTKVALVVRKEGHDLRCYAHVGVGNYHVKTAWLYTDVGLLTCNPGHHHGRGQPVPLSDRLLARRVSKSCWSRRSTCASASCKTSSGKSSTIKPDGAAHRRQDEPGRGSGAGAGAVGGPRKPGCRSI